MPRQSAGLLMYRRRNGQVEFLLVHPGGPFWANRDDGAWSIPKGEFAERVDPLDAARREFHEETGGVAAGPFLELQPVKQRSGKVVHAWLAEGDFDPARLNSNTFTMEWPPRSGKLKEFVEVDRAEWFTLEAAHAKILEAQWPLLLEASSRLADDASAMS